MLSQVERIIFLKSIPFFESAPMRQLLALAAAGVSEVYSPSQVILAAGDVPRALYIIVNGQVQLTYFAGQRSMAQILEARDYFGEAHLFDDAPCAFEAHAGQETLLLKLSHDALAAMMKTDLTLSFDVIRSLSREIKQRNEQIAQMTRKHTRGMHQLFDKLDG